MLSIKSLKKVLLAGGVALSIVGGSNVLAKAQICSEGNYVDYNSDELHIITSLEPELLEPASASLGNNVPEKKSASWYSWLTESHNMPSLHFIQFLELFEKS
ncbi:hypothetical protein [Kangiella sediminilitoris]|uniref:Uncharacterized protein n=1 Tax=Kangiella sediminilitoris TaxID=1144748 RepID=A0A1B3B8U0_9GAMM|nr:hypothetical protein [Kangiella sediminilitoris]AOE49191.1 hypothetical protein KS2013_467 [Kangiella sediminilitoris]